MASIPTNTSTQAKNYQGTSINFGRLQKIVAYFDKSEAPQILRAETFEGSTWTFVGVSDFEKVTGFPARKQDVFDIELNKFVSIDDFNPRIFSPNFFYITKPSDFRAMTCLGLSDYIAELRKIHEGDTSGKKRKLPSEFDQCEGPHQQKRVPKRCNSRLAQRGKARVTCKQRYQPYVEVPVRRSDRAGPSKQWAEAVAAAFNHLTDPQEETPVDELASVSSFEL
ncbi:hypothetical protein NP233_g10719 [Leucocoprinus birnbaumii]|uniref:Uncharacterized protein n=1 Tax=Leucocoprinus birnbaumii TaxID=56174 RepID=A0AAD5VHY2_9AGAR|nr:hypothetical protein NP233_g10719 [Leucocoprinus birnbaumii]